MRGNTLPILLVSIVSLGIFVGGLLYQTQHSFSDGGDGRNKSNRPAKKHERVSAKTDNPTISEIPSKLITNLKPNFEFDEKGLSKTMALMGTTQGVIKFKFYSKFAPISSARIAELINVGFYNGLSFHRVIEGFIIQTGDPSGDGSGGSGKSLKAEFSKIPHTEGTIGLAHGRNPNSGDSQFYITLNPEPHLDGNYTVLGQVIEGMDVAKRIRTDDKINYIILE
jgi:cyclophilin family peptidyl-prolyl cis-trans isomerase